MSKSENVPKMSQDALPYPLPAISPIWKASHGIFFTISRIVCLLFTLGLIAFDIKGDIMAQGLTENDESQPTAVLFFVFLNSSRY